MVSGALSPAAAAFDAIADDFDYTFDPWLSVAAQRRAVREELVALFPPAARLLEVGGGTGTDAEWMKARGYDVLFTDVSPAMVARASRKLGPTSVRVAAAEELAAIGEGPFDGVWSNFAGLNCVTDLRPVGQALAALVRPGGMAVLVVFGRHCPAEVVTEAMRGRFANCFRRMKRGDVPARLGGRSFTVRYHHRTELEQAMEPGFRLIRTKAIGLFVPPSAAEPWISRHPRMLAAMEAADKKLAVPLAALGDHVLHVFERCGT